MGLTKKNVIVSILSNGAPVNRNISDWNREVELEIAEAIKVESGIQVALERLKSIPEATVDITPQQLVETYGAKPGKYKQRDFDAEARGKTRCVQFQSALESTAIAGMQFETMEEYLKLVKQAADAGVAYSFQE